MIKKRKPLLAPAFVSCAMVMLSGWAQGPLRLMPFAYWASRSGQA